MEMPKSQLIKSPRIDVGTKNLMQGVSGSEFQFLDFLESTGQLDAVSCKRARSTFQSSFQNLSTVLLELGLIPDQKLADLQAQFLGLDRIQSTELPTEPVTDLILPQDYQRSSNFMIVDVSDTTVTLATAQPFQTDSIRALGYFLDKRPVIKVIDLSSLSSHLARLVATENFATVEELQSSGIAQEDDIERLRDVARDAPTIKLLNRLIASAVAKNASDIHIEPAEDLVRVRFRIDGALQLAEHLPKETQAGLTSRVKILSRLNIAEQRLPQDGRIRIPIRGRDVDLRVSTTPVLFGESIAMRILDRQEIPLDFAALGFSTTDAAWISRMISQPNGIILVTGPTGSGKTTTLYAALSSLNTPTSKLFSVEDPVEFHLNGVNQIQVKPQIGLDFAAILRSVLRQDPDIVMVGEMRDLETARIAVQASLTGHLVLSTLHTNSAAASITRLLDMGVEDYLLASCLRGVIAQRLVRKLCTDCRERHKVSPEVATMFKIPATTSIHEARGCGKCGGTGYRGRTVIYELLAVGPDVRHLLSQHASESQLEGSAKKAGMTTMFDNARDKILEGETSVDEVMRIIAGSVG
jgi:general secretion pathway protein E